MKKIILGLTVILVILSCQKEENEPLKNGEINDIDGNQYSTVIIGTQEWITENLRTTKYCNGDPIENVTDNNQWRSFDKGAWAYQSNDSQFESTYGKLYNWFAVNDFRNICPCGWHVPSDVEWKTLTDYLGGEDLAGGKMKSTGTRNWRRPNQDATNNSGFSGLPGGSREPSGGFNPIGANGYWWSSTEALAFGGTANSWGRSLYYDDDNVIRFTSAKTYGFSVRCIKN